MHRMLAASVAALISLATASASASIFVTDLASGGVSPPVPGNQNWAGQMGDDFTTTAQITITRIGVFDDDGDGTLGKLYWQLFDVETGSRIRQETVEPSGARLPGTGILSNYVFADLALDIVLPAGHTYSVIAYGFDTTDRNFNTNVSPSTTSVEFNTVGLTAGSGRWDYAPFDPTELPGITGSYHFATATFEYTVAGQVPEPASLIVWSLLATAALCLHRRRRHA